MSDKQTNPVNLTDGAGGRRMVIRIVSGARANQIEELPIDGGRELVFGRDPDVAVKFDPELDDLVSRRHARIVWDGDGATAFQLEDLGSSNGTLHNGTRISESTRLRPGDSIQLGAGGPKAIFDLDPRPEAPPATRLATAAPPPATRQAAAVEPAAPAIVPAAATAPAPLAAKPAVGRETVERMVASAERQSGRRVQFVGLAVAVLAVVAAIAFYMSRRETAQVREDAEGKIAEIVAAQPMSPAEIAERYSFSTVFLEVGWSLVHTESGEELYHYYQDNGTTPTYIELADGSVEPILYIDAEGATNRKIASAVTGSGFVVTQDGFILTNRHVVAGWRSTYDNLRLPGRLFVWDSQKQDLVEKGELREEDRYRIAGWVPSKAAFLKKLNDKAVNGRHIRLDVTFPKDTLRIPARVVRESDVHDVALIKIDLPNPLNPVNLYDNYDTIRVGEAVTVLGYPTVSLGAEVEFESLDALDRSAERRQVPDPTLSPGVIGRIHRGTATPVRNERFNYWSQVGDAYQMTIDTAGRGNSGGPVFDDRGRVVGIYTYGRTDQNATVSFAVPIRYGQDLMKIAPVLR